MTYQIIKKISKGIKTTYAFFAALDDYTMVRGINSDIKKSNNRFEEELKDNPFKELALDAPIDSTLGNLFRRRLLGWTLADRRR